MLYILLKNSSWDAILELIVVLALLILRIFIIFVCVKTAKKLNRDHIGWGLFGLLAPIIAYFWIKSLRPIAVEVDYECIHCDYKSEKDFSFCPKCKKNDEGLTFEEKYKKKTS